MRQTKRLPPSLLAANVRDTYRRGLNAAIAVLTPGRSNDLREAIAETATREAKLALPTLEAAEQWETRMKRSVEVVK